MRQSSTRTKRWKEGKRQNYSFYHSSEREREKKNLKKKNSNRNLESDPSLEGLVSLDVSREFVELLGPGIPDIPPPDSFRGLVVGD